jgi:2-iminobutanoate/2-iminopropanoate deaminase
MMTATRLLAPLALIAMIGCQPRRVEVTAAPVHGPSARPLVVDFAQGPSPGPFSPSVRVGNLLFLSGMLGQGADGRLVPGGIQPETRQTLENIKAEVERRGSSMDRVVKCTVFLADMAEWGAMNQVYVTFFPPHARPARSALGSNGLALNARVEIECIAVVD